MVKNRFIDLEKGYGVVHGVIDEEYTMLLPGETCSSCEKKKIEKEKEQKRLEIEEKERERAWREYMLCSENCTIL